MGAAVSDRIMALAGIIGTISGNAADLFACWDLAEQIGQHRRITDVAPGDLDGPNLQCLLIDPKMYLAPTSRVRTAMQK